MPLFHLVTIALIQGITEFLPISSSGHLLLVPELTGWRDQGLLIDISVHVGTLGAVIAYCWRDIVVMLSGIINLTRGKITPGIKLFGYLIIATIPVVLAGFFLKNYYPNGIRNITIVGWSTLGFGILLFIADRIGMTIRRIEHIKGVDALLIGLAQILALIPGTSRSGITITVARLTGMERPSAARFSMLLGIPTIIAAGALEAWELFQFKDTEVTNTVFLAAGFSFVSALATISVMMLWLRKFSFTPFVIYRIILGALILSIPHM